jgi:hypothetical protein
MFGDEGEAIFVGAARTSAEEEAYGAAVGGRGRRVVPAWPQRRLAERLKGE